MSSQGFEELGKEIKGLTDDLRDWKKQVAEQILPLQEFQAKAMERFEATQAQIKAARRELPSDAPVDTFTGNAATQKGGLLGGTLKLPFKKALALSPRNPMLRGNDAESLKMLHDYNDAAVVLYWHYRNKFDHSEAIRKIADHQDFQGFAAIMERFGYAKANEIQNPGGVTTLDFTLLSSTLLDMVRINLNIANQFVGVPLTRHKQDFPTLTADALGVRGNPSGTASATAPPVTNTITVPWPGIGYFTKPTFGSVSFNCEHCLGFIWWNDDMIEDSVIPFLPVMREQASFMIQRAIDRACLDGDSISTHQDHHANNAVAAPDFRTAWEGLRHIGGGANNLLDNNNETYDGADFRRQRRRMGKFAANPNDVVAIMNLYTLGGLLDEDSVLTVDKFGPQAVVKTGVLAKFDNIDIVPSEWVRMDLNASGVYDDTTTTRTVVAMANRTRFLLGMLGNVEIETTRVAPWLLTIIQADVRCDFQPIEAVSSGVLPDNATDLPVCIMKNVSTVA